MSELLRLEHINYSYEGKYHALKDVSATIHRGERIAVLGGNGAGKSTFFLCCNGVLRPQTGEIFLNGQRIANTKRDITLLRQTVGLVFQDPDSQIIGGTVENEISFGPMNLGLGQGEVRVRVTEALLRMNLEGYEKRAPQYLSGGEKKRLSIADILAMHPDLILLDEPTASLDPENVSLLEQTLNDLSAAGITLAVSTHDVDFAYRFATRAIVFARGEIISDTDIDEAFSSKEILVEAGLKKPSLYEAAELLEKRFLQKSPKPKCIEEFRDYIEKL